MALEKENIGNNNFITNLKKRASKSLKVEPVFLNSKLENEAIAYLQKQSYLDFAKLENILKNNFIKEFPFGYVLMTHFGEIVGFLGTMFSDRNERESKNIYCNLHTWIVNKSYRLNSYLLLLPLMEERYVVTTFTPIKTLIGLYQKFGFQKLEMIYRVFFSFNLFKFFHTKQFEIKSDERVIKKHLNKIDLKIYNDHIHLKCFKFLIMDKYNPKNNIFVIAVKNKRKIFHVLDFIYISNSNEFKKYGHNLCTQIGSEFNVMFCGQHFLHEKDALIPEKKLITKDIKREVCMKNLPVNYNFDTLYSEFVY